MKDNPEARELVEASEALDAAVSVYRSMRGSRATARLYSVFTEVVRGLNKHPKGSFELNSSDHCLSDLVKHLIHRKSKT